MGRKSNFSIKELDLDDCLLKLRENQNNEKIRREKSSSLDLRTESEVEEEKSKDQTFTIDVKELKPLDLGQNINNAEQMEKISQKLNGVIEGFDEENVKFSTESKLELITNLRDIQPKEPDKINTTFVKKEIKKNFDPDLPNPQNVLTNNDEQMKTSKNQLQDFEKDGKKIIQKENIKFKNNLAEEDHALQLNEQGVSKTSCADPPTKIFTDTNDDKKTFRNSFDDHQTKNNIVKVENGSQTKLSRESSQEIKFLVENITSFPVEGNADKSNDGANFSKNLVSPTFSKENSVSTTSSKANANKNVVSSLDTKVPIATPLTLISTTLPTENLSIASTSAPSKLSLAVQETPLSVTSSKAEPILTTEGTEPLFTALPKTLISLTEATLLPENKSSDVTEYVEKENTVTKSSNHQAIKHQNNKSTVLDEITSHPNKTTDSEKLDQKNQQNDLVRTKQKQQTDNMLGKSEASFKNNKPSKSTKDVLLTDKSPTIEIKDDTNEPKHSEVDKFMASRNYTLNLTKLKSSNNSSSAKPSSSFNKQECLEAKKTNDPLLTSTRTKVANRPRFFFPTKAKAGSTFPPNLDSIKSNLNYGRKTLSLLNNSERKPVESSGKERPKANSNDNIKVTRNFFVLRITLKLVIQQKIITFEVFKSAKPIECKKNF